jgi:small subunit ribosomal protein S20
VEEAVANKDVEAAKAALTIAIPKWDKAASKGVIHRNNAARKISRLTRKVNAIMAPATVEATS